MRNDGSYRVDSWAYREESWSVFSGGKLVCVYGRKARPRRRKYEGGGGVYTRKEASLVSPLGMPLPSSVAAVNAATAAVVLGVFAAAAVNGAFSAIVFPIIIAAIAAAAAATVVII